jgi:hypothetical protein
LKDNDWVGRITLDENFSMAHLHQFVHLWVKVQEVHLTEEIEDDISWKLTANGQLTWALPFG